MSKKDRSQKKKVVNKKYAKSDEYGEVISEIEKEGKCPFCPENFKYHKEPILKTDGDWLITRNSWPYENTGDHFILIGEEHKETIQELTKADLKSVKNLTEWAVDNFDIKGGALAIRFGDTDLTGATVSHLHFQLIIPEENADGSGKTVTFPIG